MPLMLPNPPQFSRMESNIDATPDGTPGTTVNHYASGPHVKNPTYTELIASTAFDANLVIISVHNNSVSNGDSSTLLDIAIGAASSETVIIPNLCAGFLAAITTTIGGIRHYIFPLFVPATSRLSARTQSIRTTGGVGVLIQLFGGPRNPDAWWYGHEVTAYGPNTANSAGTKFTPGNAGSEGTGASLGTTSRDHECLVVGVQGHPDDVSWGVIQYYIDIGLGSSSTEWFSSDYFYATGQSTEQIGNGGIPWWPIYRSVPSGTELMIRAEASGTADALSGAVYGVS